MGESERLKAPYHERAYDYEEEEDEEDEGVHLDTTTVLGISRCDSSTANSRHNQL